MPMSNNASALDYFKNVPTFDPYNKTTQAQFVALFGVCGIVLGSFMAARDKEGEHPVYATIETVAGLCYVPVGFLMVLFAGDIIEAKSALVDLIKEEFAKS